LHILCLYAFIRLPFLNPPPPFKPFPILLGVCRDYRDNRLKSSDTAVYRGIRSRGVNNNAGSDPAVSMTGIWLGQFCKRFCSLIKKAEADSAVSLTLWDPIPRCQW
jgi:hypothetical protein